MLTSKYLMEAKMYGLSLILTFTDISYKDTNYHVKNESLVFLQVSSVIKTGQLTLTKFIGLFLLQMCFSFKNNLISTYGIYFCPLMLP